MMLNIQKLKDRLNEFETGQKQQANSKLIWKPKEGENKIRIVPSKFQPDCPFFELAFYYNLGGKHYLSPACYGLPDPIQELAETLRSSGVQSEKELAKKLQPSSRTYVPIIVRGEEDQGVKYWGFGAQVYKQLLKLMTNSEWGDITSLSDGNDLTVDFKKESGKKLKGSTKSLPETTILATPRKTPVVDPSKKELLELIKNQVDIKDIYPVKPYEELKDAVLKWIGSDGDASDSASATPSAEEDNIQLPTEEQIEAATAPKKTETSTTTAKVEDFEDFFKS